MRLRHVHTGIQILVTDDKARRLIAEGSYAPVPAAEQPPEVIAQAFPQPESTSRRSRTKTQQGPTSIAAALRNGIGPHWDQAIS